MKQTDFAICLNRFLTDFLVNKKGCSPKTIDSYRYAFIYLLDYYNEILGIPADQIVTRHFIVDAKSILFSQLHPY